MWAIGVTLLGYYLGQVDFIEKNLELATLTVVAISVLPVVREGVAVPRAARLGGPGDAAGGRQHRRLAPRNVLLGKQSGDLAASPC
jgi:membrane-associated protein